ncbi:MAG: shikimate dehydrogenase [Actinomycetota bacterium]
MIPVSGSTLTVGVIGDPVRHSLSPRLHNAAFDALGVDARSLAFPVAAGSGAAAVDAMRTLGLRGLSVTMPHKEAVADAADDRSGAVAALGAANCLVNDGGYITAVNTDGDGFVRSLMAEQEFDLSGQRIVVLGAGGAARSVAEAVGRVDVADLAIVNRTSQRAAAAVAVGGPAARIGTADDVEFADLVVNATPLGMGPGDPLPVPRDLLGPHQLVVDLIYQPLTTPLLAAAADCGASVMNGVAMLLHQAAIQLEFWTGRRAPVDAMRAAVASEMGQTPQI